MHIQRVRRCFDQHMHTARHPAHGGDAVHPDNLPAGGLDGLRVLQPPIRTSRSLAAATAPVHAWLRQRRGRQPQADEGKHKETGTSLLQTFLLVMVWHTCTPPVLAGGTDGSPCGQCSPPDDSTDAQEVCQGVQPQVSRCGEMVSLLSCRARLLLNALSSGRRRVQGIQQENHTHDNMSVQETACPHHAQACLAAAAPRAMDTCLLRLCGTCLCDLEVVPVHDWGRVVRAVWLWYSAVHTPGAGMAAQAWELLLRRAAW